MKNVLLLSTCLLAFSFSLMAQNTLPAGLTAKATVDKVASMDGTNASMATVPKIDREKLLQNAIRNNATVIQLGSSYNLYSILLEFQNQVHYVPELNALSMVHRQNAGAVGGSGILSYDYSLDGGATWVNTNNPITPMILNGNRYPNGAIYNPPGNTDPENAQFVAAAASLYADPNNGNGWGWEVVASSPLIFSGLDIQEDYYSTPDTNSYIPGGLTANPSGELLYVNITRDTDEPNDPVNFTELVVSSLNFDGTSFVRTAQELPINQTITLDDPILLNSNLACSPDGLTCYTVAFGTEAAQASLPYGYNIQPVVFKSGDGGGSWALQDAVNLSCLDSLVAWTFGSNQGTGALIPTISTADIVVDEVGDLHFFAEVASRFTEAADSVGFFYGGRFSTQMFHLVTDGTVWRAEYISSPNTDEGTIGTTTMDHRPQASRTPDGTKIFMTWVETDTLTTGLTTNDAPDTYSIGYDVAENCYTPIKNLSTGTGGDFQTYFSTISPVSIDGGTDFDYEIPIVYAVPTADDLAPIDYWYIKGAGFDESDFGMGFCGTSNSTDGSCTQTVSATPDLDAIDFKLYPNPTNGLFSLDLTAFDKKVDIQIINTLGAEVISINQQNELSQIDMSNFANGVYFVRVQSENDLYIKKFVLSK